LAEKLGLTVKCYARVYHLLSRLDEADRQEQMAELQRAGQILEPNEVRKIRNKIALDRLVSRVATI
jgi:hypothetical protein